MKLHNLSWRKKDPVQLLLVWFACLALILGASVWAYLKLRGMSTPIILNFSPPEGISQIGEISDLFKISLMGIWVVTMDLGLAAALLNQNRFWSRILILTACVIAVLIFIAFAAIISNN